MTTLASCGDTLSIAEFCAVVGISRRTFDRAKRARTLPVRPLVGLGHWRFSKVAVQRFLDGGLALGKRRAA